MKTNTLKEIFNTHEQRHRISIVINVCMAVAGQRMRTVEYIKKWNSCNCSLNQLHQIPKKKKKKKNDIKLNEYIEICQRKGKVKWM